MKEKKNESLLNQSNTKSISINNQYSINYVTDSDVEDTIAQNSYYTSDTTGLVSFNEQNNDVTLPIYFGEYRLLQLPKGLKRRVKRLPLKVLKPIDKEKGKAVEKCYIFLSSLTFNVFRENPIDRWKALSSKILNEQFRSGSDNTCRFNKMSYPRWH